MVLVIACFACVAQAQPPASVRASIKAMVAKKYPSDFYMQNLMYDGNCEAFDKISYMRNRGVTGVPTGVLVGIINRMMERYPDNYYMQELMAHSECEAYLKLHP